MKKEEIIKQLKELTQAVEALADEKTAFEVGKWYVCRDVVVNYQGGRSGFGVNCIGNWEIADDWSFVTRPNEWTPATEEEIKTALVKEAEKRGFKEGVRFKSASSEKEFTCFGEPYYNGFEYDQFLFGEGCVYKKGQWAEIIKNEPLKVAGYEVKYELGCVTINNETYPKQWLFDMIHVLNMPQIKSLNVGCSGQHQVTKEDIQKIINGFNK